MEKKRGGQRKRIAAIRSGEWYKSEGRAGGLKASCNKQWLKKRVEEVKSAQSL